MRQMKYLFINSVYGKRSTGKIVAKQCAELSSAGNECMVAYGRGEAEKGSVRTYRIGTRVGNAWHGLMSRLFDMQGLCSSAATKKLIKVIHEYMPDVIWLHNLHGYYINYEILFDALKSLQGVKVYWTLHDCWAFTGHCAYFTAVGCEKWRTGCRKCIQKRAYPITIGADRSQRNYERKKAAFAGVGDLTLITPSKWLAELTRESFLSGYPVEVVYNTVDQEIFKPTPNDVKNELGIADKKMILGVAVGWEETKGMPDILRLRSLLSRNYVIVLIGEVSKKYRDLPEGILGIASIKDQKRLAQYYTAADVLINPTHQDNYPTVNLEAAACGTPVITYRVGGSSESVDPENVVEENDVSGMAERIKSICSAEKKLFF